MTTSDWISVVALLIQLLLFGGLVWYCIETARIRVTARDQVEVSQTPCLTFAATPRNGVEAVLEMDDARGAMVLDFDAGDAMLKNIGCGPAVNIEYSLVLLENPPRTLRGYVSFIPATGRATAPIPRNSLQGRDADCLIRYESLSRTKYETKLTIKNLVLTPPFQFAKVEKEIPKKT